MGVSARHLSSGRNGQVKRLTSGVYKNMDGLNTEQTVIGILLNDCSKLDEVKNKICAEDFEDATLQVAFKQIDGLCRQGIDITPFSVASGFGKDGRKSIENYLVKLDNMCCSTQNLLAWADILKEKSVQRQLKSQMIKDGPCCDISDNQKITSQFFEEVGMDLLHKLPAGHEQEYVENIMVACNRALSQLLEDVA